MTDEQTIAEDGDTPTPISKPTLTLETRKHKPPRIIIYGPQGLGKSTFGAQAKKCLCLSRLKMAWTISTHRRFH